MKPKTILKPSREEAPQKTCEEEKKSEHSLKFDAFSEEDLSELLEKSTMEDADFHDLQYQPLQIQLERLLGDDADGYLNPTVKESPRKTFDLAVARKSKSWVAVGFKNHCMFRPCGQLSSSNGK